MRIIAGALRGRRLVAPKGLATRPTTDRVREAWFSILHRVHGRVIDIYAGTGALGFEALSRGASMVTFVESATPAQDAIIKNAEALGVLDRVTLIRSPIERARAAVERGGPYDLVLTDPPWTAMDAAERALRSVLRADLLTANGRVVLGHPKGKPVALDENCGLELLDTRNWGGSAASFFEVAAKVPADQSGTQTGETSIPADENPASEDPLPEE